MKTALSAGILAVLLVAALMAQISPYSSSDAAMKKELENFKVFIQEHPRALAELKKDPSLIRATAFAEEHKVVGQYLEQHAKVREEIKKYPNFFDDLKATTQGGQHKNHPPEK